MNKREYILDVPGIQKIVSEKHKAFLQEYGSEIEKVLADHSLFADIMLTKLYRIVLIFKQEGIINDIRISEMGPYKRLTLSKSNCNNYIDIATNGKDITIQGYAYTSDFSSDNVSLKHKIYDANLDNFNWTDFSRELLDYIHKAIYERTSAVEARLQGLFEKNTPPEDDLKILKKNESKKN